MDRYEALTADDVRAQMRTNPNDAEWDDLVAGWYVGEVVEGEHDLKWLDDLLRKRRRIYGRPPAPAPTDRTPAALADWAGALACLLAAEASQDPKVVKFRQEVLGGTLLASFDAANEWLSDVARTDLNGLDSDRRRKDAPELSPEASRLAALATRLAQAHGWNKPDAVAFVLTGHKPMPSVFSVGTRSGSPTWLNRITLTVHPMVDPKAVMNAYTEAREQFKGWSISPNRVRTRDRRVYEIAAWVARNDADNWNDLFDGWKSEHPEDDEADHPIPDAAAFRRYATRGLESICGPGQRWKLGSDDKNFASSEGS